MAENQDVNFIQVGEQKDLPTSITVANTDSNVSGNTAIQGEQEKFHDGSMPDDPVMGAMSFAELEAVESAANEQGRLAKLVDKFRAMARNIMGNAGLMPNERVTALRNLSTGMKDRLDDVTERSISIPTINGKLDSDYLQKLTDSTEATKTHNNTGKSLRSGFKVLKAKDGSYRWLGWVSNKFMDREGEILTEKAHLDYIAWLDENPQAAPELWTFHIPGTQREKRADFWGYLNGFLVLGGGLTTDEAKALQGAGDLAMSHGFYVLEKVKNLIGKYRTFEATVLPREAAANPWTEFNVKELINMALTDKQRELATQLHGNDFVAALESDTKARSELLSQAGIQQKADEKEEAETKEGEKETTNTGQLDMDALVKGVSEAVVKQMNPEGLQQAIKTVVDITQENTTAVKNIVSRLEKLEQSDDEKMAKQLEPKTSIDWMGGFQASKADKTILKENDEDIKLKEQVPNNDNWTDVFTLGED